MRAFSLAQMGFGPFMIALRTAALALVFAVAAPSLARAQDLSGLWVMQGCWGENCSTFTETFELAPNGTFQAWGYRDSGTWSASNGQFSMVITTSDNTAYTGVVRGGVITGTMHDNVNNSNGTFSMQEAGGPVADQARLLRGSWEGNAHWNTGDSAFVMVFNADGTFHVDNGKNGQWGNGSWQMNGSRLTIRYGGSDNTVFSGSLQGNTITGATTDSNGHSGTFSMSR